MEQNSGKNMVLLADNTFSVAITNERPGSYQWVSQKFVKPQHSF